jgi:hypothetical protein
VSPFPPEQELKKSNDSSAGAETEQGRNGNALQSGRSRPKDNVKGETCQSMQEQSSRFREDSENNDGNRRFGDIRDKVAQLPCGTGQGKAKGRGDGKTHGCADGKYHDPFVLLEGTAKRLRLHSENSLFDLTAMSGETVVYNRFSGYYDFSSFFI